MRPVLRAVVLSVPAWVVCAAADAPPVQMRASWIHIGDEVNANGLTQGQQVEIPVEYSLAPGPAATLTLTGLGPWIDCPDGTYTTERHHVGYPGLSGSVVLQPGSGRQVFTFTAPVLATRHTGLLWQARFSDGAGKAWPWDARSGGGELRPAPGPFTLVGDQPGNLFTYDQPLALALELGATAVAGEQRTAVWTVLDRAGGTLTGGSVPFTVERPGQRVPLPIATERRGVLGLRVEVAGWGAEETTFARIPDLAAVTGGARTRFGMHFAIGTGAAPRVTRALRVGRRLGLTACRVFFPWEAVQPGPDAWRLAPWDRALDLAAAEGVGACLCLQSPPQWAISDTWQPHFQPFAFDRAAWQASATALATRWKGKVESWEWLNEIVPGEARAPVGDYVDFVRIGTTAVRAADPAARIQLAGGLWPRNFRRALLAAGIAQWLDVLPIHYGDGAGIRDARRDLDAVGAARVAVWDNETAHGLSTWGMPLAEMLRHDEQGAWVMARWPGELAAGAERIEYFGGAGDPAGNWDYSFEDNTPRPVAATIAVLVSKLHGAEPQGSFRLGDHGPFHLFARGGRAVLVLPTSGQAGEGTVTLATGGGPLVLTDDQGEERGIDVAAGGAALPLGGREAFIEGGDLDVLRAYTTAEILTPELSVLAGRGDQVVVTLRNRGASTVAGSLALDLPAGWPTAAVLPFSLAPRSERTVTLPLAVPEGAAATVAAASVACRFADQRLPLVTQPVQIRVLVPAELGNLLVDGGCEGAAGGAQPVPGLGAHVLRFAGNQGWQSAGQALTLAGGRSYLYSAWVHGTGMEAGSNIDQRLAGGRSRSLYLPDVFIVGNAPEWQLVTAVYQAPKELEKVSFTPVARVAPGTRDPAGAAVEYDNLRVTVYDGTAFAAEATRVSRPPVIDGRLDEWSAGCPIPLLGPGQTTVLDPAWKGAPGNLGGVVRLAWDDANLYLAAEVRDDTATALTGEQAVQGDSLVLALHPADRAPGTDGKAFAYYLSAASPGGGSGRFTLYRPAAHAGGLSSGQLAKDSSVHEIAITRDGDRTVYEARFPWSELGVVGRFGVTLGCSLQLNDNDGSGRAAFISWGAGLAPAWAPDQFGVVTLVGP